MLQAEISIYRSRLLNYCKAAEKELNAILTWWGSYMVDNENGGFYGSVNNENIADTSAEKGIVLNSRICWTFSAAFRQTKNEEYLQLATKAYSYIQRYFVDKEFGGVYWSVNAKGEKLNGRKQVYGQAFCIYALSEYYKATSDEHALDLADELFQLIEKYSFDKKMSGYLEAFAEDWSSIEDLRLSDKDDNEKKTMNTHLHIIEAYANLYQVRPTKILMEKIIDLLRVFDEYMISRENAHLHLFFTENWELRSALISFGHDIEAAWLLLECAEIIDHEVYISRYRALSISMAKAALEGWDPAGGLWYEFDPVKDHWVKQKHSWPQAEAMVGFFNAWQISGDEKFLHYSEASFDFINKHIKDHKGGEWYWGIEEDGSIMPKKKAGFWKCPYHNSRACLEIIKRTLVINNE